MSLFQNGRPPGASAADGPWSGGGFLSSRRLRQRPPSILFYLVETITNTKGASFCVRRPFVSRLTPPTHAARLRGEVDGDILLPLQCPPPKALESRLWWRIPPSTASDNNFRHQIPHKAPPPLCIGVDGAPLHFQS